MGRAGGRWYYHIETTHRQIGYTAVEQVVRRIDGGSAAIQEQVFSGELIVRGSTCR